MKVRFLKKFRKRFSINYAQHAFLPVNLLDHVLKKAEGYSSISYAVAQAAYTLLGFNAWRKRYEKIERRQERLNYYKSLRNE